MNDTQILSLAQNTIKQQAYAITELHETLAFDFVSIIKSIQNCHGKLVWVGVGKSGYIAQKIVATLNSTGTPAQFLHAGEATHGDLGLVQRQDIVFILSKSGNTEEIKRLFPFLEKQAAKTIGICMNATSFLAKKADQSIIVPMEKEADPNNLAPTTSTSLQLVLGDAIAVCLMMLKGFSQKDFAKYHPGGALGKRLYWRVKDLLDPQHKPWVNKQEEIKEVIVSITKSRSGVTAVLNDKKQIVGVITDGDLRRMLQTHDNYHQLKAKDIMSKTPRIIAEDQLALEALKEIKKHEIGQLLVVDANEKYIGIIDFHTLIKEGISI